jgi:aspartate aminotransferase
MASIFTAVEKGPPIEVFALNKACVEDTNPEKVNLGVGGKNKIYQYKFS